MTSFDSASRRVLSEFLQTAVVIDDAAYPSGGQENPVPKAKTPSRGQVKTDDTAEAPAKTQSAHSLDTRLLVDTFASKGLVCAVIAPHKEESIAERLGPVAERCDIVVIDWQIFDDDGERTRALIEDLCNRDNGSRLRLLCVYSGEDDLEKISDRLTQEIDGLTLQNDNKFLLRKDHVIVTILGKHAVPEDKIANILLDHFSVFTKGLLSNTVLAALTGIRRNVNRIVQKFEAELDPAYISHRIMSKPVDTVENEILSLIASELESVVHQSNASAFIDSEAIEHWMDSDAGEKINYDVLPGTNEKGPELLKQLIKHGADEKRDDVFDKFKETRELVTTPKFIRKSRLTQLLGAEDSKNVDRRFAILSTLETRYEDYIPQLTLGTIVHEGNQYILCLLPRCDSARVPVEGRNFLFIRLTKGPSEIDLVVNEDGEQVDLGISRHPYDTVIYRFAASTDQTPVMARTENGKWLFDCKMSDGSVGTVRWVADMKPQIAQAFANEYASQVCRVGVTKSQWLHQLGRQKE